MCMHMKVQMILFERGEEISKREKLEQERVMWDEHI